MSANKSNTIDAMSKSKNNTTKTKQQPNKKNKSNNNNASSSSPFVRIIIPATSNSKEKINSNTTTIIQSTVDPWIPRIQNNDEYLERGLDFSININTAATVKNQDKQQQQQQQQRTHDFVAAVAMGDLGAIRLAHALSYNTQLIHLNLAGNEIGMDGGIAIAKSLYSCLEDTTHNRNGNGNENDDAFAAAIDSTTTTSSSTTRHKKEIVVLRYQSKTALQSLNLSNNAISNEGAKAMALALRYNTSLVELDLSYNGIGFGGIMELVGGEDGISSTENNSTLRRLILVGNNYLKESSDDDNEDACKMKLLTRNIGKLLLDGCSSNHQGQNTTSAVEVLDMHNRIKDSNLQNDSSVLFGGALNEDNAWCLVQAMYGIGDNNCICENDGVSVALKESMFSLPKGSKLQNHRFHRLSLSNYGEANAAQQNDNNTSRNSNRQTQAKILLPTQQLLRILNFNTFYRPIMELHNIMSIHLRQNQSLTLSSHATSTSPLLRQPSLKLPHHLQRDNTTGAIVGLLPSTAFSSSSSSSSSGVGLKLMPRLLSFTTQHCRLDTFWNIIRYRPDIFRYAGRKARKEGNTIVDTECCGFRSGGGCTIT